jgi:hypothetical protein
MASTNLTQREGDDQNSGGAAQDTGMARQRRAGFSIETSLDDPTPAQLQELDTFLNRPYENAAGEIVPQWWVGIWNTYLHRITNKSSHVVSLADGENHYIPELVLAPGQSVADWNIVLPWCSTWNDVVIKAIYVAYKDGSTRELQMVLWQDYCKSISMHATPEMFGAPNDYAGTAAFEPNPWSGFDLDILDSTSFNLGQIVVASKAYGPYGPQGGFNPGARC